RPSLPPARRYTLNLSHFTHKLMSRRSRENCDTRADSPRPCCKSTPAARAPVPSRGSAFATDELSFINLECKQSRRVLLNPYFSSPSYPAKLALTPRVHPVLMNSPTSLSSLRCSFSSLY